MDNKDVIHDLKLIKDFFEEKSGAYPICLEYAIKVLKNELSADRPQGEWIKDKSKNIWNMVVDCYKCSNCGKKAIDHSLILDTTGFNYCPNCGARMKGADDESV